MVCDNHCWLLEDRLEILRSTVRYVIREIGDPREWAQDSMPNTLISTVQMLKKAIEEDDISAQN